MYKFETKEYYKEYYSHAPHCISECKSVVILCPGYYKLERNIITEKDIGIVIASSNVILDLQNFNIRGTKIGIAILPGVTRVKIINGSLIGFSYYGIYSRGKNEFITIDGIIVDRCASDKSEQIGGILFQPVDGILNEISINNCTVTRIISSAIHFVFGIYTEANNCTIDNCNVTFCEKIFNAITVNGTAKVTNCRVNNCKDFLDAIVVEISTTTNIVENCIIENNSGIVRGVSTSRTPLVVRNIIHTGNQHNPDFDGVSAAITCGDNSIVEDIIVTNNSANNDFIGVQSIGTGTAVKNVSVNNNTSPNTYGVLFEDYKNIQDQICKFTANNITMFNNANGSCVSVKNNAKSTFKLSISNCKSQFNTGKKFSYDLQLCTDSLLTNSLSEACFGGVIAGEGKVTIADSKFVYNSIAIAEGPNTTLYNNLVV